VISGNATDQDFGTGKGKSDIIRVIIARENLSSKGSLKMQAWVDRHPILFVLSDVLFLYFSVSLVVSWWSGWAVLARHFRFRGKFIGSRWRCQSGNMRWFCGYSNCLTVGANSEGLYLSTLPFFPLFHPPLFIPWTEVSFVRKDVFFIAGVRFGLGRETSTPLWVRGRLADRLKGAAGLSYPVETLGR
jgi:hypothetical protein